jgi:uncharacterized protein YxjI
MPADTIPGVDLTGDTYVVKQNLVRNKYRVFDGDDRLVLRAKQKLFKMKEEFPFVNADGEDVFTVKAGGILDIAGDYTLTPAGSDEPLAILDKNFTIFKHVWKVRDPHDERVLATIESGSVLLEAARNLVGILSIIPHSYTITGPDGEELGSLEGRLSLKDTYDLHIGDVGDAPKEAIVASAVAIDALEGN